MTTMTRAGALALAILGLLGLVFLHELGHFTAAKRTGMRALKFYVGFPPPLARKQLPRPGPARR